MPYADPTRCPDCRAALPTDPAACPGLRPAAGGPAGRVAVPHPADRRRDPGATCGPRHRRPLDPTADPAAAPAGAGPAGDRGRRSAYPAASPGTSEAAPRRGLSAASVPRILLGLGALCLLAAAVIFLAVAWSWLGVGGRTAVLVSLTLVTGALGTRLGGRGLRVAAESLTAVALGLLALDVVGADNAGWLGDVSDSGLACAVGGALLLASLGLLLAPAPLVVPQVVSAIGLAVLVVGATGQTAHDQVVAALAVLAFAGLAFVGRLRGGSASSRGLALAGGAFWWATLALDGFAGGAGAPHGDGPVGRRSRVGDARLGGAPAAARRVPPLATRQVGAACGAGAALIVTVAVALPGLDEGATELTLVSLGALVLWTAVAAVTPTRWALIPGRAARVSRPCRSRRSRRHCVLEAVARVADLAEPFTRDAAVPLPAHESFVHPALLVPSLLALSCWPSRSCAPDRLRTSGCWPGRGGRPLALGRHRHARAHAGPAVDRRRVRLRGSVRWRSSAALRRTDAGRHPRPPAPAPAAPAGRPGGAAQRGAHHAGPRRPGRAPRSPSSARAGSRSRTCSAASCCRPPRPRCSGRRPRSPGVDEAYRAAPILLVVGLLAILLPRVELEASAAVSRPRRRAARHRGRDRRGLVARRCT